MFKGGGGGGGGWVGGLWSEEIVGFGKGRFVEGKNGVVKGYGNVCAGVSIQLVVGCLSVAVHSQVGCRVFVVRRDVGRLGVVVLEVVGFLVLPPDDTVLVGKSVGGRHPQSYLAISSPLHNPQ